jgi:hypothetical protein
MRLFISLVMVIFIFAPPTWADCKSDCQSEYESEITSCKTQYSDPEDADDLQMCLDDAKSEYASCNNECED